MKTTKRAAGAPGITSGHSSDLPADVGRIQDAAALRIIPDSKLLSGIRRLSAAERRAVLGILVHLVEIDRRRLYLEMGYSSLFEFCVKELGYSESSAVRRIRVARCMSVHPAVYHALASGRIDLTNMSLVTGMITAESCSAILSRIEGASKREVELLVSSHDPRSAIRDRVRPVHVRTFIEVPASEAGDSPGEERSTFTGDGKKSGTRADSTPTGGQPALERVEVVEERYELRFGVDRGFLDKVERVRSLLSTAHRSKLEFGRLFEILLDEHIEQHSPEARARRRENRERAGADKAGPGTTGEGKVRNAGRGALRTTGKGEKPSGKPAEIRGKARGASLKAKRPQGRTGKLSGKSGTRSRHIPRSVHDEVFMRDGGRCTYVSPCGRRCGSTWDLQVDHIVPFARGGGSSPSNLRLLCGRHNRLEAQKAFGEKHMEQFLKESGEIYTLGEGSRWRRVEAQGPMRRLSGWPQPVPCGGS